MYRASGKQFVFFFSQEFNSFAHDNLSIVNINKVIITDSLNNNFTTNRVIGWNGSNGKRKRYDKIREGFSNFLIVSRLKNIHSCRIIIVKTSISKHEQNSNRLTGPPRISLSK